jgi:UDP-N-acetylmuramoyl-L-alanyl-D-glutamate--2,6-diaminopimelate ligase
VPLSRPQLEKILDTTVPEGVETVSGVTHDSRSVLSGFAFVAVPGFKRDGMEFADDALRRGAVLIVVEREAPELADAPTVVVPSARRALATLADALFGHPSEDLLVYGITGTNGKTTTSFALHSILSAALGPEAAGLVTTAGAIVGGELEEAPKGRTTPEAVDVQSLLARMRDRGVERVVMEVSSHGIALERVGGIRFGGALFTNLTRDHLDLHGTMEVYYATKRELFYRTEGPKLANAEDEWGRRLAGEAEGVKTFGGVPECDYRVEDVYPGKRGTVFSLKHAGGRLRIETPLLGPYNVLNVAGAVALALEVGIAEADVARAAARMPQVPGRFERVGGEDFEVVVDYAHTDVGLEAVLGVARGVAGDGRVLCVFGAAGERDGAKRPLMGRIAAKLADRSIVTTDDAYGEDPALIADEVAAGAREAVAAGRMEVIIDRREAIKRALSLAKAGDVVVVAGKGHETVQHLPDGDVPFHDASVVRELLAEKDETEREGVCSGTRRARS